MLRRGFWESFQMGILNLEQAHDQLLFFQKQASYAKPAYFFYPEPWHFNEACQQKVHCSGRSRWHNEVFDMLKMPHTLT